jgi:hypothetical protein
MTTRTEDGLCGPVLAVLVVLEVKNYSMSQIEFERRDNYQWYGDWGAKVAAEYAKWKTRMGRGSGDLELRK